jgi:hypothetical protein
MAALITYASARAPFFSYDEHLALRSVWRRRTNFWRKIHTEEQRD